MHTVNQILDRFEKDYMPGLRSKRTRDDYARHVSSLRQHFGKRAANELVASDFDAFMNVDKGKHQRNRQLSVLSSAFSQAVWWGWLTHNVCLTVHRHSSSPRERYVTKEELDRTKALLTRDGKVSRVCLAMDIASITGMLQGEILDLRWTDVNQSASTITYLQQRYSKRVTIRFPSALRDVLAECWQLPNRREYVLSRSDGGRYTSEGFRALWQRSMDTWVRAGNSRYTFQDIHMSWVRDRESSRIPAEIQEIVNRSTETPSVELKQWMRLSDPTVRANIARHLAALTNYGGGYLIFGFRKDGQIDPAHPGDLHDFTNDEFAGIIDKYLDPPFHCEVVRVRPDGAADDCVVVHVPPHGTVPVCSKAGGPHDPKGRPQGIVVGRYYIRVNGPKSEPIESPEQWQAVIHRCVVHERRRLLDSIAALLQEKAPDAASNPILTGPTPRVRKLRQPKRLRMGSRLDRNELAIGADLDED